MQKGNLSCFVVVFKYIYYNTIIAIYYLKNPKGTFHVFFVIFKPNTTKGENVICEIALSIIFWNSPLYPLKTFQKQHCLNCNNFSDIKLLSIMVIHV